VPLGLAYVGVIMMARSLSMVTIVEAQRGLWFVVLQPIGFLLYLVTGLMQSYRAPFSSRSRPRSAAVRLARRAAGRTPVANRARRRALHRRRGRSGSLSRRREWSLVAGLAWMLIKTYALMVLMLGLGRCVRPLATAEMLALSWKILIPLGLLNVLLVGGLILLGVGPRG